MADTKEFFLSVTQRVFSNWAALRMAVEHGMGSKERAIDFCPYMTEVMYMNDKLTVDEVAEELEDYLDEQFHTELEDNSANEVADVLLKFYNYCIEGNESVANAEFEKLPPLQLWIRPHVPVRRVAIADDDSDSESEEELEKMDVADEWVEVKSRRKR